MMKYFLWEKLNFCSYLAEKLQSGAPVAPMRLD